MKTPDQWSVWLTSNFPEMSLSERNKIIDFANMEEKNTTERELKFRAWDRVAKQMSPEFVLFGEFTLVGAVFAWQADFREGGDSLEKLNDLTIMQFTGLTDKEGKEIYDQDILRFGSAIGKIVWHFDGWQIEWITYNEGLRNRADKLSTKISTKKLLKSVLLGNAFQNPELLK